MQAVKDGDIKIVPERFEKIYNMWLENIKDWCISRQLWWGHRIPVYYIFPNQVDIKHCRMCTACTPVSGAEAMRGRPRPPYGLLLLWSRRVAVWLQ